MSIGGVGEQLSQVVFEKIRDKGQWLVSFRDVSRVGRVEAELQKTRDFLDNVIQSSADAIVAADLSGQIILFNRAAENLLGLRAIDVIGHQSVTRLYEGGRTRYHEATSFRRKRCARSAEEYSRRDLWCRRYQDPGLLVCRDCL